MISLQALAKTESVTVGAKKFTENYVIGEIFAQLLEDHGISVQRKFGMGGTMVAYQALKGGEIDVYPEYSGTISEAIFHRTGKMGPSEIQELLDADGIEMLPPLGFANSYCIVMKKAKADQLGIRSISDLQKHPHLTGAFSFEFQARSDGWNELKKAYALDNRIRGIEIPLTYQAVQNSRVDFAEAYSTEPLIRKFDFVILTDDKEFFPEYDAVALVRKNLNPKVIEILNQLQGKLTNSIVTDLNTQVVNGESIDRVANQFLHSNKMLNSAQKAPTPGISWSKMLERTKTHLLLTGLAVILATLVSLPLAALLIGNKLLAKIFLTLAGILQTIPSIALLTFMIPIFGIGFKAALFGLFIYSILPILRNAYTAMTSIDPNLLVAARGIGLYPSEIFFTVKLPIAFPTILAGIRTATILNIGTATLAAFIGGGGLGEPIVTGLALNDYSMVLQGAIPAAALAMAIDVLFGFAEKQFTKKF